MPSNDGNCDRIQRAQQSLDGLSIGDAFGQCFFAASSIHFICQHDAPPSPWKYTDDTAMAIAIVEQLEARGSVDQNDLITRFATAYNADPHRGYGYGAQQLLARVIQGEPWQTAASQLFGDEGSFGNGGAMRVAPIGAFFADDLARAIEQARLSAEVTHAHPDGQAGAVAVSVAAALAWRAELTGTAFIEAVTAETPDSPTRDRLKQAIALPLDSRLDNAIDALGNGSGIISADTVPFCIWCAGRHLESFQDALWTCVTAGGDRDTTAAIVGGIVAMRVGRDGIPDAWRQAREPLPIVMPSKYDDWARE